MSRRSAWAVLAVLSLVGTLLALPVGPALGRNGEQDDRALYSACPPGSALESAGFRDIATYPDAFEDVINCMANYGIMPGLLPGLFQPGLGVTRQQMALILIRAAYVADIDVPAARDQGFRDIDDLSKEVRDSINQLAQLRITLGTTPSTYTPDTVVNRRQMAQFFERFLALAPVGEGGVPVEAVNPDDNVFTDLDHLTHDPYDAIRALYELGVTAGTTATTYGPDEPVTRAQMAMFISRMLAHTNARPAGITMQVESTSVTTGDTVDLIISVRDEEHQPVEDAPVDLFFVPTGDDGFLASGRCSTRAVVEAGFSRCSIDVGDEFTDPDGNLLYTMSIDENLTVYAWTGDSNERFDLDSTEYATLEFNSSKGAHQFVLTDDMREGAKELRFGTTVNFFFQVADEDENPVFEEDVEIQIETIEVNGGRSVPRRRTYSSNAQGRIEIDFRLVDPDSNRGNSNGELRMDVLRSDLGANNVVDKSTVGILSRALDWSDDVGKPRTLLIEQRSDYTRAAVEGASNQVTATLLDQYGDPVRGERVHFTSDDPLGLSSQPDNVDEARKGYVKTTSRRGIATVTYSRKSSTTSVETIYASTTDLTVRPSKEHYWVGGIPSELTTTGTVELYDEDDDTLIIKEDGTNEVYLVRFDDEDHFHDTDGPLGYEGFKEALDLKKTSASTINISAEIKTRDRDSVNVFRFTT